MFSFDKQKKELCLLKIDLLFSKSAKRIREFLSHVLY